MRKKQIFKDIKILADGIPCQRKAGRAGYRPPASNLQTHHNPNGHKTESDCKTTSNFINRPPLLNSPESLKVQNEEGNPDVDGTLPPQIVDLDLTLSICANDEWDNTVQIPVSAAPSYSKCAADNRKTGHNIYITDHPQVCLTTLDCPQITKEPKKTNLENKRLESFTIRQV